MDKNNFLELLRGKMDEFAHLVYSITKKFPKEELYGITSQLRRAALSVILNFIEGYARKRQAVKRNFWETSYGSLKESKYLIYFSLVEGFLTKTDYEKMAGLTEEIGAMLWRALESVSESSV